MRFIAHRGNVDGIVPEYENSEYYIELAINLGYDVEIDVWYKKGWFILGHDEPKNITSIKFLLEHQDKLWCHAKNIETFNILLEFEKLNCFYHQTDDCALTSHHYLWTYFDKPLTERSILLKFDKNENYVTIPRNIYGICSDYIRFYKEKING
jgi:hypothetical protein